MTHDITNHPHWNHDEFVAFLLFYAASADMECTDEEKKMILDSIHQDHLPDIEKEYARLSDFERIEVIQSYRPKYFQNTPQKEELLQGLKKVFSADGEYDMMERSMFLMLQRIL